MDEFESIYRQHVAKIFGFVLIRVGRRDAAEDITSEVFLSLHEHWDEIHVAQLPAWLFTVARNLAIDYWRRQAVESRYAQRQPASEQVQAPATSDHLFENPALKAEHRICLLLRYAHGMTPVEISKHTGYSNNQVKSYLQYGRSLLRKQLENVS